MKALFFLTLFCASLVNAQDANVTRKVFEKRDQAGSVKFRLETVYRGTSKVMMITSRLDKDGAMKVSARSYFVNSDLVMAEMDGDLDGTFETVGIYHPSNEDMELFFRQADGSVKPADSKIQVASKKELAAITEFWDKAFQKEMSDQELERAILQIQKKIQDAETEKKNNK